MPTSKEGPTFVAHLKSFCQLPALATVGIPLLLLAGGASSEVIWGHHLYFGLFFMVLGVGLFVWTNLLFHRRGKGTLAPWNPTKIFVAEGIYCYIRNPMISGVFLVLIGEALILRCVPIFLWALVFILTNFVYIPTWEEPDLVDRFGDEYVDYRRHVPPWFPRVSPYSTATEGEQQHRRLRLIGFFVFVCWALVHLGGAAIQTYCVAKDKERFPPPGRLYNIDGTRLHGHVLGQGSPVVVFDAGMGSTCLDWGLVHERVAARTTALVYDRAGLGWSDPGLPPRNSSEIAKELRKLLVATKLPGPYILVGHSYGSYNVRTFQRHFPEQVSGLVLVDGSLELAKVRPDPHRSSLFRFFEAVAHFGFVRLGLLLHQPVITSQHYRLGPKRMAAWRACYSQPAAHRTFALESLAFRDSGIYLANGNRGLGDLPLAVVSAEPTGISSELMRIKSEQVELSSVGRHYVATGSGHYVHIEEPELVVEAIDYVVNLVRKN